MSKPKILVVDVETSPSKGYFWRLFDENIGLNQVIEPGRIICWGAKWLGQKGYLYEDDIGQSHKEMMRKLGVLLAEADAVVSYNGDKFDLPKINGAMCLHRLPPVPPLTSIDLIKTIRRMGLLSSRLEYVLKLFGIGEKIKHEGMPLWTGYLNGDKKCRAKMRKYNLGDIRATASLYRFIKPYMHKHPALGPAITGKAKGRTCKQCHHKDTLQSRGYRYTQVFKIQRTQCTKCGDWADGKRERMK